MCTEVEVNYRIKQKNQVELLVWAEEKMGEENTFFFFSIFDIKWVVNSIWDQMNHTCLPVIAAYTSLPLNKTFISVKHASVEYSED